MSDVGFNDVASSFMCGSEVFAYFCNNGASSIDDCLNNTASTTAGRITNPYMIPNDSVTNLILKQYDEIN